jgi:hypothetical protein
VARIELGKWLAQEIMVSAAVVPTGDYVFEQIEEFLLRFFEEGRDEVEELLLAEHALHVQVEALHYVLVARLVTHHLPQVLEEK